MGRVLSSRCGAEDGRVVAPLGECMLVADDQSDLNGGRDPRSERQKKRQKR